MPVWVWIVAAAVALVVIVLTVVLVVRHRRKKAKQVADDDDWDWEPADLGADKQGKIYCHGCRCADAGNRHGRWHRLPPYPQRHLPLHLSRVGMRFSDIAHTCAQNLLRRKSRTILTVLGVIVGCCSIVLMISIGQGISEQNEQMLKSMGNLNDITVTAAGGSGAYDSSGVGMSSLSSSDMTSSDQQAKLDDAAVQTFRGISGVAAVMPQRSAQSTVDLTAGAGSRYVAQYASVMGTDMTQLEASGYKLVQGRMPRRAGEVLLGKYAAYQFMDKYRSDDDSRRIAPGDYECDENGLQGERGRSRSSTY